LKVSPTVEIAPGVFMPILNHGDGNQSLWLEIGGRGMSTNMARGDETQIAIGQAVKSSGLPRSELFVQTMVPCCPSELWDRPCQTLPHANETDKNIEHTLQTIGIRQVDLLLLHWPCANFQDTLIAYRMMETAVSEGKARAIGVSNFNHSLLADLAKVAKVKPAVTQNGYSVGNHRDASVGSDDDTLGYCKKSGVKLSAYSPLGSASGASGSIFNNPAVKAIAEAHNKSVAQIAIRWDVQQGILPVTSGSNRGHLMEDLDVFDFTLTDDEMTTLAAITEDQVDIGVNRLNKLVTTFVNHSYQT